MIFDILNYATKSDKMWKNNKRKIIVKKKKRNAIVRNIVISLILIITVCTLSWKIHKKNISKSEQDVESVNLAELENFVSTDDLDENDVEIEEVLDIMEKDENLVAQDIKNSNLENKKDTNLNTGTATYKLEVNVSCNVVNVYTKDAEGNYTKCVKAMVCSTGGHTPQSGTFYLKSRWRWRALFNNCYGQYAVHITGNILFHSVPYTNNGDPGSLEYWEYDKLGTAASLGCVRLKVSDVLWIYNNCPKGTMVRFYTDSNPGPLGKPSAQKISSNETCRGWDPTDPNSNNPWKNYKETPTLQTNTTTNTNNTETNKNTTITNTTSAANTITNTTNTNTTHSNTTTNTTTNTTNTNTTATNIIKNEVKEKNIIDE